MSSRNLWLPACGLVYAVLAALLVHTQADAYRGALNARRVQAGAAAVAPPSSPGATIKETVQATRETSAPTTVVVLRDAPAAVPPTPEPKREAPPSPPSAPAVTPPPREVAAVAPAPSVPKAPKPPAETPTPLPVLIVADVDKLSAADEAELGKLLNILIATNHEVEEDGPFRRAVTAAVRPIVDLRRRKDVEISITVLNSDDVNAFSHVGGYIYVTRGLFNFASTPEEFMFVVGHELAHLDRRDAQTLVAAATRAGRLEGVGTLQALYHQIAAGYTKEQEFAADARAAEDMRQLDISKRETLSFLRKFIKRSEEKGFPNGGKVPKTPLQAPVQDIDNQYRSQPAAWERLDRLSSQLTAAERLPTRQPATAPAR